MYLIFPKTEKMVCVTSIEAFEDTRGSANHLEGTPRTMIVSGREFPVNTNKIKIEVLKELKVQNFLRTSIEFLPRFFHLLKIVGRRDLHIHFELDTFQIQFDPGQPIHYRAPPVQEFPAKELLVIVFLAIFVSGVLALEEP